MCSKSRKNIFQIILIITVNLGCQFSGSRMKPGTIRRDNQNLFPDTQFIKCRNNSCLQIFRTEYCIFRTLFEIYHSLFLLLGPNIPLNDVSLFMLAPLLILNDQVSSHVGPPTPLKGGLFCIFTQASRLKPTSSADAREGKSQTP